MAVAAASTEQLIEPSAAGTRLEPLFAGHRLAPGGKWLAVDQFPGPGVPARELADVVVQRIVLDEPPIEVVGVAHVAAAGALADQYVCPEYQAPRQGLEPWT